MSPFMVDRLWHPALGAWPDDRGFRFRVWAPTTRAVDVVVNPGRQGSRRCSLEPGPDGTFVGLLADVVAGDTYGYLLEGEGPYPDPVSRFQPEGVHQLSAVVDPRTFAWTDRVWRGIALTEAVIYELHVGTFSPEGTFAGATARLPYLSALGITAVELMPVADFPGRRNWGYDGVSLFAPARCYGTPDDLRRFIDTAHGLGLAVLLDVVCNHFGPDGAYAMRFSPFYLSTRHRSPWGAAVNLDGEQRAHVRAFLIESALCWLHEYHVDGLRLDATHTLVANGPQPFLRDLAIAVRTSGPDRSVLLMAEDDRNLATIVRPLAEGGWGFDAIWADDFHHHVRRLSAGDRDGYFQDFSGSASDIATTLGRGWFFCGQHSAYRDAPRGTDPIGVPVERMIICLQNHDQIGNRALGERLTEDVDPAVFRALSAVLLFAPETPLIFMGQEWAAASPFLYFTDHKPDLGRLITDGRRAEFSRFTAFASAEASARIPDPQALSTFEASRLRWSERDEPGHAGTLALYRMLLRLRRHEPALRRRDWFEAVALDDSSLALARAASSGQTLLLVARLRGAGTVDASRWLEPDAASLPSILLTTEDPDFVGRQERPVASAPEPVREGAKMAVRFRRPSALILRMA